MSELELEVGVGLVYRDPAKENGCTHHLASKNEIITGQF